MRSLIKVAIALVVAGAAVGMLLPVSETHRDIAVAANDGRVQLVRQGVGQQDQNLKLLLAKKVFEGGGQSGQSGDGRGDGHGDPSGKGSGGGSPGS